MNTLKHAFSCLPLYVRLLLLTLLFTAQAWALNFQLDAAFIEKITQRYGPSIASRVVDWQQLMRQQQSDDMAKLTLVNNFFNQLTFRSDREVWHKEDYWATPIEFLLKGMGDCEDFSIAKYFTLKALNIPEKKIRITYVKSIKLNQAHMVLAYYPTPYAEPYVLDNLDPEIKLSHLRNDLVPIYSFNGDGLWLSKERGKGKKIGSSQQFELWNDLAKRMQQELVP